MLDNIGVTELEHKLFLAVLSGSERVFREDFEGVISVVTWGMYFVDTEFALGNFFLDLEGVEDGWCICKCNRDFHFI